MWQSAAGCFKFIRREIIPEMGTDHPPDLTPEMLDALITMMLAQAQECVCIKATMEHMKPGTIARLASQASDMYGSIHNTSLPSEWQTHIDMKAAHFTAVAQYHKANECISQAKYGEEIARLRIAAQNNQVVVSVLPQHIKESEEMSFINDVRNLEISIKRDLLRAEKDNDVVYMENVPQPDHLSPILRSETVKPMLPLSLLGPDHWRRDENNPANKRFLFETLMPLAIHRAANAYAARKDQIIKTQFHDRYEAVQREWQR